MASCSQDYSFGPHLIRRTEVFAETPLSFAFVNLKPVVPGHVLVSSKRVEPRFTNLSGSEVADLWKLAQDVGRAVEKHFGATSLTLAIQDGQHAGQSVPHVHVHILPRRRGDFEKNDDVYDAIDGASKQLTRSGGAAAATGEKLDLDAQRRIRTPDEMAAEAAELSVLFQ
ncbi:HIT-like protein [Coccomyxa subellipsoidea C-169]|uniref:Bis(5'-adenosyl)-triphosphatase n=1 Tax=Coccomyxa subellipsoidea (strain C-169) TaxID=574566 RepID=I0Z072_COCSC|nr:HIT-like protein [Coccomyxa subellipsoidea C-169]EIE24041.1 HIT-like protein [Coccomyxa subellipsoidea C-169]|eukprot:XP_005648585.1 HIT-like protein [Coccomyxa subellipsoidea C-169]